MSMYNLYNFSFEYKNFFFFSFFLKKKKKKKKGRVFYLEMDTKISYWNQWQLATQIAKNLGN
jgi:hypothetical protein